VLRCDAFSEALGLSTAMTVLLPEPATGGRDDQGPPPVLYLLHGMSDDHTTWLRRTSLERHVAPLRLAVVMPQVHRSYYHDEARGGRYWTFLSEELPALVHRLFRVAQDREDTFVAGLSMGGYGAVRWALRAPSRFAAAASLSGALDLAGPWSSRIRPEDPRLAARLFGDESVAGSDADLLHLVAHADPASLPALRLWCGTEDPLLPSNSRFADACATAGVNAPLVLGPGGHDWAFWDARVRDVLAWLPLRSR
jgi:putative tributyrin esterase